MGIDSADAWHEYWETASGGARRRQVERAAADPVGRWLVVDAPGIVDDVGVDPADLRENPDAVLADARDGFAAFVAASDLPGHGDDRYDYDLLPIHLTTVGRLDGVEFSLADAAADANRLTTVENAPVVDGPDRHLEAAVVTYECPRGHETTVRQPLFRTWTLDTCPTDACSCPVVPDDVRTRPRTVVRFAVETREGVLPCVATGKYGADPKFDPLAAADSVHLTGVVRLLTTDAGGIDSHYEVLAVEPTSP